MLISRAEVWALLGWVALSCAATGAEATSPASAETEEAPAEVKTPAPTEPTPKGTPTTEAPAVAPSDAPSNDQAAGATESAPLAEPDSAARNVKYIVSPDGMRVEVEGISFAPKVEAIQKAGGWGVKLKVEVRAKDGKTHSILAPEGKELAFAGRVKRKDQSEPEAFSDRRDGDRELVLDPKKPLTLSRSFPTGPDQKPLASGDELEIMVGIWGLGEDAASRRPLKKFCKVTLKLDKPKPRAVVAAPDGVTR